LDLSFTALINAIEKIIESKGKYNLTILSRDFPSSSSTKRKNVDIPPRHSAKTGPNKRAIINNFTALVTNFPLMYNAHLSGQKLLVKM
jgi:hypothetical protein